MIQNIGHDGSGIHSNKETTYHVKLAKKAVTDFPAEIKEDQLAYQAIKKFLKNRKGNLLQRGIRFFGKMRDKYMVK